MRTKIIIFFLFMLFLGTSSLGVVLYEYNKDLQVQLKAREQLINNARLKDSLFVKETKRYADTITKYISDCEFTMNGKKISTAELLRITNEAINENQFLKDSLSYFNRLSELQNERIKRYQEVMVKCKELENDHIKALDSSNIYRKMVEITKRDYGIEFKVEKEGDQYIYSREKVSKADSALLLFPYYKEKLRRDSTSNTWIIRH